VLQITGFTENPRSAELRYKRVQRRTETTAVHRSPFPKAADLCANCCSIILIRDDV
jgi:hypothetical protein